MTFTSTVVGHRDIEEYFVHIEAHGCTEVCAAAVTELSHFAASSTIKVKFLHKNFAEMIVQLIVSQ